MTQEQFAWACGFAKSNLSQIEAGKGAPSLAALLVMARQLRVDLVDIVAANSRKPLHRLVDAIRRRDHKGVVDTLELLCIEGRLSAARNNPRRD
jgi:transcriptional regulator with XRE-family HTH domain